MPPKVLVSMISAPAVEISAMNVEHDVRPGLDQILVAALQCRAAEIGGGEVLLLQHGAHGAVE